MKIPAPFQKALYILLAAILLGGLTQPAASVQSTQAAEFSLFRAPIFYPVGSATSDIALGDINGDGSLDIVTTNHLTRKLGVFINQGDGAFVSSSKDVLGEWVISVKLYDMDGDGDLDAVVTDASADAVVLLWNDGTGNFPLQLSGVLYVGNFPDDLVVADFNGDGKPDLAVANLHEENVSLLINSGGGTFLPHVRYPTGGSPAFLEVDDFNRDGKLDLVSTNPGSNTVSVLMGNGDGTFQTKVDYGVGSSPSVVIAEDHDQDGIVDLIVANSQSHNVSILLGHGDGTFQHSIDFAVGMKPYGMSAGDFNGDKKIDLVTANFDTGDLSLLLNQGDGILSSAIHFPLGGTPSTVQSGDLNNDSKLDLVTENGEGSIGILFNAGTNTIITSSLSPSTYGQEVTFTAAVTSSSGIPTGMVKLYDGQTLLGSQMLDGDGKAVFKASTLTAGAHAISVKYSGEGMFPSSSASLDGGQAVNPAPLTITAHSASKTYGSDNPPITYTISGLVNSETPIVLGGSPRLTTIANQSSGVGEYAITATQGGMVNANYYFTYDDGTLTINPALLTVKAESITWSPGQEIPALTYTITGFVNGEDDGVLRGRPNIQCEVPPNWSAGQYPITITRGSINADNYVFTFEEGVFTIVRFDMYLPILVR